MREDHLGPTVYQGQQVRKEPLVMLENLDHWGREVRGVLMALQESRVKMEKQGQQEMQERWDSQDLREQEGFLGCPASRV